MERVVGGKFKIGRKIGSGSFGEIYIGKNFLLKLKRIIDNRRCVLFFYVFMLLVLIVSLFAFIWLIFTASNIDTSEIVAVKMVSILSFIAFLSYNANFAHVDFFS